MIGVAYPHDRLSHMNGNEHNRVRGRKNERTVNSKIGNYSSKYHLHRHVSAFIGSGETLLFAGKLL